MTQTRYAIWYPAVRIGNVPGKRYLFDGVTSAESEAERAKKAGATVLSFRCHPEQTLRWGQVPKPHGAVRSAS